MTKYLKAILTIVFAAGLTVAAQTSQQRAAQPGGSAPAANTTVNPLPQSPLLRILTPVAGQSLSANFVSVNFELTQQAAVSPNFLVQLDGGDATHTTTTEASFTGLTPGIHSVTVTAVDANDTPIAGARSTVQFKVPDTSNPANNNTPAGQNNRPRAQRMSKSAQRDIANSHVPTELRDDAPIVETEHSASLPIISVIGFGVLIGGVASAMRTR